jgi:ribosomal protein S18 acetylase RimI-like enzyme
MSIPALLSRLVEYQKRHGWRATLRRAQVAARRAVFAGEMVVFYCDLDENKLRPVKIPAGFSIERRQSLQDLSGADFEQVTGFWNPKLAGANIRERFGKGASLWLVKAGDRIAGFGWTMRGSPIEPYYFPIGTDDVQLFDFYVSTNFRGRALHWLLTSHLLNALAVEGAARAFADTGEWNDAQLASFRMTKFHELGRVRTCRLLGRLLTCWTPSEPAKQPQNRAAQPRKVKGALRSNE